MGMEGKGGLGEGYIIIGEGRGRRNEEEMGKGRSWGIAPWLLGDRRPC